MRVNVICEFLRGHCSHARVSCMRNHLLLMASLCLRQPHGKRRPLPLLAFNGDLATLARYQHLADRQAEPRTFPSLCREERIENPFPDVGSHASAGIRDLYDNATTSAFVTVERP